MSRNYIKWFDELNQIVEYQYYTDKEELLELVQSLLIDAYKKGREDVEGMLDYMLDTDIPLSALDSAVNKVVGGKTTNDRVKEYLGEKDALRELQTVVQNECHRVYNEAGNDTAYEIQNESGLVIYKSWKTMLDTRVRDTHDYLEGMSVRLGERFYTFDDDSAYYPGGFEKAENNINCRCFIEYSQE